MNRQVFGDMIRSRMIEGANKRQGLMQQTADAGRNARVSDILDEEWMNVPRWQRKD